MPSNLELKARCHSIQEARRSAEVLGAHFVETLHQLDIYFQISQGRLKLRVFSGGSAELIFYVREESTAARYSNYTKTAVADPEGMRQVLEGACGIRALVKKTRDLFLFQNARIHLDRVEGLGDFLEFEVMEGNEPENTELMKVLRYAFGIDERDLVLCSYSDLILGHSATQ